MLGAIKSLGFKDQNQRFSLLCLLDHIWDAQFSLNKYVGVSGHKYKELKS